MHSRDGGNDTINRAPVAPTFGEYPPVVIAAAGRVASCNLRHLLDPRSQYLAATGAPDWMVVPEPLTEVPLVAPGDTDTVYVTRHAMGGVLAELAARFPEKVTRHVPRVVRYLARIHGWLENETARARGDHWAAVQSVVAEYGDRIGVPDSNHLGAMVVGAVPHILPAVARRDAHAENWLVTPAGQIVALDLEGDEDLPLL